MSAELVAAAAEIEARLRLDLDELCPHGPEEHAEGTCEVCDTAFAIDARVQEAFEELRAALDEAQS